MTTESSAPASGLQVEERLDAALGEIERLREVLEDTREFISRARPLLGIAMGNSLGKQADELYVEIGNALEGGGGTVE